VGERPGGHTGDDLLHRLIGELDHCYRCTYGLLDQACVCGATTLFEAVGYVVIPTPGTGSTTASSTCAAQTSPQPAPSRVVNSSNESDHARGRTERTNRHETCRRSDQLLPSMLLRRR